MRWPVRTQLLLPVALLLAGVAAISVTTAAAATREARAQLEARRRTVTEFMVRQANFPLPDPVLHWLRQLSGADYLLLLPDGTRRTSLEGAGPGPEDLAGVEVVDDWRQSGLGSPVPAGGVTYLCGGVRLHQGVNQGNVVYIFYPESIWRDARWQAIWPSLVLGLSSGLASLAIALAQSHRLSRRFAELIRRTRLIASGDFSPMPLPDRDDEIRDLAQSINEMAQRLAQFHKSAQTTERLRLLGQVSGGLAHQFRNGLTGARLAVQLHLRELPPDVDASALEVALRQLTLLETHVKRFLDLGRAGPPRRELCSLAALVSDAVDLLRPRCRHADIELTWRPPSGPAWLDADPGQLSQLIVNLLTNAIDAAGPGGQVGAAVEDAVAAGGSVLVMEVCDSGPGPAAEVAERLFEPFVTSKPEGVGLGLAVSRQVAEGHGGKLSWGRRDGRTCFRVELPAAGVAEGK